MNPATIARGRILCKESDAIDKGRTTYATAKRAQRLSLQMIEWGPDSDEARREAVIEVSKGLKEGAQ